MTAASRSRSGATEPDRPVAVLILVCECLFVVGLLLVWALSETVRNSASLPIFFLYGIPSEFVVAVVPHEPAVIYMATLYDPLIVAVVAGAGTLVAEILNYHLLEYFTTTRAFEPVLRARAIVRSAALFERAPFACLWIAGLVPVIPFLPVRFLAVARRYSRSRFLTAAVTSRTARFYILGVAAAAVDLPVSAVVALFIVLIAFVTVPGVYRVLAVARKPAREYGRS